MIVLLSVVRGKWDVGHEEDAALQQSGILLGRGKEPGVEFCAVDAMAVEDGEDRGDHRGDVAVAARAASFLPVYKGVAEVRFASETTQARSSAASSSPSLSAFSGAVPVKLVLLALAG